MTKIVVEVGDAPELDSLLAERIYEFNAAATGCRDAELFRIVRKSESGELEAGLSGYTWARCCFVSYLWVSEPLRGKGLGTALLSAAEEHAAGKGCLLVLLSSHSFQAPEFYARRGYQQVARIEDHPVGHASFFFSKRLDDR
ncbi:MAG TPA: GNAT family N-acetyltransferase [Gammaproteobacteria bacterium]|nr:GNAT family N-acetyltransferase [Gammaproteobacteria bacterium]